MGATRPVSSWVMRTVWVLAAVLAAVQAIQVPVEGSRKHRRQTLLSPSQPIHEIDKNFAAVGSHHDEAKPSATGSQVVFHQPDPGHHAGAHKSGHKSRKLHRPVDHVAPHVHPAPSNKHHKKYSGPHHPQPVVEEARPKHHRVGPKSLRHDHEAQATSSDHHHAGGKSSAGKTHEHNAGKTTGGGGGEHHRYHHNHGEDEKQHHARQYEEGKGADKHYNHDDSHKSSHGHGGHGGHSAKHVEFNHRDKSGFTKGFRDKYHKDESHKLNNYWSNGHEKGAYEKFGLHKSHYHDSSRDKVKKSQHKEGTKSTNSGKKGHYGKAHADADSKGHKGHGGHESQHGHHSDYAKKGGTGHGNARHFEHGNGKA